MVLLLETTKNFKQPSSYFRFMKNHMITLKRIEKKKLITEVFSQLPSGNKMPQKYVILVTDYPVSGTGVCDARQKGNWRTTTVQYDHPGDFQSGFTLCFLQHVTVSCIFYQKSCGQGQKHASISGGHMYEPGHRFSTDT